MSESESSSSSRSRRRSHSESGSSSRSSRSSGSKRSRSLHGSSGSDVGRESANYVSDSERSDGSGSRRSQDDSARSTDDSANSGRSSSSRRSSTSEKSGSDNDSLDSGHSFDERSTHSDEKSLQHSLQIYNEESSASSHSRNSQDRSSIDGSQHSQGSSSSTGSKESKNSEQSSSSRLSHSDHSQGGLLDDERSQQSESLKVSSPGISSSGGSSQSSSAGSRHSNSADEDSAHADEDSAHADASSPHSSQESEENHSSSRSGNSSNLSQSQGSLDRSSIDGSQHSQRSRSSKGSKASASSDHSSSSRSSHGDHSQGDLLDEFSSGFASAEKSRQSSSSTSSAVSDSSNGGAATNLARSGSSVASHGSQASRGPEKIASLPDNSSSQKNVAKNHSKSPTVIEGSSSSKGSIESKSGSIKEAREDLSNSSTSKPPSKTPSSEVPSKAQSSPAEVDERLSGNKDIVVEKNKIASLQKMFSFKEAKPSRFGDPPSVSEPISSEHSSRSKGSDAATFPSGSASYLSKSTMESKQSTDSGHNKTAPCHSSVMKSTEKFENSACSFSPMESKHAMETSTTSQFSKVKQAAQQIEKGPAKPKGRDIDVKPCVATTEFKAKPSSSERQKKLDGGAAKSPLSKVKALGYKKGDSSHSLSTSMTVESLDRSTARHSGSGGEVKLEFVAETHVMQFDEISLIATDGPHTVVTEDNTSAVPTDVLASEDGDFLTEIFAFAESQKALDFIFDENVETTDFTEHNNTSNVASRSDGPTESPRHRDTGPQRKKEEEEKKHSTRSCSGKADGIMDTNGTDYDFQNSKARETGSVKSIPVPKVVEAGRQLIQDDIPFDEAGEDLAQDKKVNDEAKQNVAQQQLAKELLDEFPEITSIVNVARGDINAMIKVVKIYQERFRVLLAERRELLEMDKALSKERVNTEDADSKGNVKPDSVERLRSTKEVLERLKLAALARKKGVSLDMLTTPAGDWKSIQVRKQEVLSTIFKVEWGFYRVRTRLERISARAESKAREIPIEFEESRVALQKSQEHLQKLRASMTKPMTNPLSERPIDVPARSDIRDRSSCTETGGKLRAAQYR